MASIFKTSKSKIWQLAYRDAQWRRVQKTSGTTDAKVARKMAETLEEASRRAREGELTSGRLKALLNEALAGTGAELVETTLAAYFDSWIQGKQGTVTPSSLNKYQPVLAKFCAFLGNRATLPISVISAQDVLRYRAKLQSDGMRLATIATTLTILKNPFSDAIREGLLTVSPFATVRPLKESHDDERQGREAFTDAEVTALLKTTSGEWHGLILLALTTGLRLGDAARLQWKSIDIEKSTLQVTTQKTGAKLLIPIHKALLTWITLQPVGIGKAPLFPSLASKHLPELSTEFQNILSTANIDAGATAGQGKGRTTRTKSFHSLRHSFVSMLANGGVSAEQRQALAGHSSAEVHQGYTHLDTEVLKDAIGKIKLG